MWERGGGGLTGSDRACGMIGSGSSEAAWCLSGRGRRRRESGVLGDEGGRDGDRVAASGEEYEQMRTEDGGKSGNGECRSCAHATIAPKSRPIFPNDQDRLVACLASDATSTDDWASRDGQGPSASVSVHYH